MTNYKLIGEDDIICLNDQGGSIMEVSINVTGTLRAQMGGHPPLVLIESKDRESYKMDELQVGDIVDEDVDPSTGF